MTRGCIFEIGSRARLLSIARQSWLLRLHLSTLAPISSFCHRVATSHLFWRPDVIHPHNVWIVQDVALVWRRTQGSHRRSTQPVIGCYGDILNPIGSRSGITDGECRDSAIPIHIR